MALNQITLAIYNDLSFLDTDSKQAKTYKEYFRKNKKLVFGVLKSAFLLGTEIAQIKDVRPVNAAIYGLNLEEIDSMLYF